jgi:hypothetical protein
MRNQHLSKKRDTLLFMHIQLIINSNQGKAVSTSSKKKGGGAKTEAKYKLPGFFFS